MESLININTQFILINSKPRQRTFRNRRLIKRGKSKEQTRWLRNSGDLNERWSNNRNRNQTKYGKTGTQQEHTRDRYRPPLPEGAFHAVTVPSGRGALRRLVSRGWSRTGTQRRPLGQIRQTREPWWIRTLMGLWRIRRLWGAKVDPPLWPWLLAWPLWPWLYAPPPPPPKKKYHRGELGILEDTLEEQALNGALEEQSWLT